MSFQDNSVYVFYTFLSECDKEGLIEKSLQFPEKVRKKIFEYQLENDRLARICSKLILIEAFKNYYPEAENPLSLLRLKEGEKPKIEGYDFDFNSSYSEDLVVFVFSKNTIVGVDVELKKSLNYELYKDFLHPKEMDFLKSQVNSSGGFLKIWTRKEALVKAHGNGIFVDFKQICVLENEVSKDEQSYHFQDLLISESYQVSLVYRNVADVFLKKYNL